MRGRVNGTVVRRVLPFAAVAAAALYAVYGAMVEPGTARLVEARERLADALATAHANGTLEMAQGDLEARLAASQRRMELVRDRSRPALDQRELFERITTIAHDTNVNLDQVRSLDWKPKATVADQVATPAAACSVTLAGRYDDLRTFAGRLETRLGFAAITRMKVLPELGTDRVRAEIELVCFAADAAATAAATASITRGPEDGQ